MENGTAYHHRATLTSAGKQAQRFVQDDEGASSASPTAGSQHRLFGGRQPAANASHSPLKAVAEGIIQASDRSAMYNLTEEKLLSFSEKFLYPIDNIVKPGIDLVHEMYKLAGDLSHSPQARQQLMQAIKSDLKGSINSINKFYHEPVIDKYNDSVKLIGKGLFFGLESFLPIKGLGAAAGTLSLERASAKGLVSSGGRQFKTARATLKADEEAAKFYEQIRKNSSNHDVSSISKNTGMPEFKIQRIKEHVFINTHKLSHGIDRFAPDIEISDAWTRLQRGDFVNQDIQLLQHEYFESRFEGIYKTDYMTAHKAANDSMRTWNPHEFTTTPEMSWRP